MDKSTAIRFELVALGNITIGGVDFPAGADIAVDSAETARWLINVKAAKSKSLVESDTAAGSEVDTTLPVQSEPTIGTQDGTQENSSAKASSSRPRRRI